MFNKPNISPKIASDVLSLEDLPHDDSPDWIDVVKFCATFDVQSEFGDSCSISGVHDVQPTSSISEMRAGLWVDYRRWNHFGRYPDDGVTLEKAREILNWLRDAIVARTDQ